MLDAAARGRVARRARAAGRCAGGELHRRRLSGVAPAGAGAAPPVGDPALVRQPGAARPRGRVVGVALSRILHRGLLPAVCSLYATPARLPPPPPTVRLPTPPHRVDSSVPHPVYSLPPCRLPPGFQPHPVCSSPSHLAPSSHPCPLLTSCCVPPPRPRSVSSIFVLFFFPRRLGGGPPPAALRVPGPPHARPPRPPCDCPAADPGGRAEPPRRPPPPPWTRPPRPWRPPPPPPRRP